MSTRERNGDYQCGYDLRIWDIGYWLERAGGKSVFAQSALGEARDAFA